MNLFVILFYQMANDAKADGDVEKSTNDETKQFETSQTTLVADTNTNSDAKIIDISTPSVQTTMEVATEIVIEKNTGL
jgi:hypothetical protein